MYIFLLMKRDLIKKSRKKIASRNTHKKITRKYRGAKNVSMKAGTTVNRDNVYTIDNLIADIQSPGVSIDVITRVVFRHGDTMNINDQRESDGATVLLAVISLPIERADIVAEIIRLGGSPNIPDHDGNYPIINAIKNRYYTIAKILLKGNMQGSNKARLDITEPSGARNNALTLIVNLANVEDVLRPSGAITPPPTILNENLQVTLPSPTVAIGRLAREELQADFSIPETSSRKRKHIDESKHESDDLSDDENNKEIEDIDRGHYDGSVADSDMFSVTSYERRKNAAIEVMMLILKRGYEINYGIDVNYKDSSQRTALMLACVHQDMMTIQTIMDKRGDDIQLNLIDVHGKSAIMHLVENDDSYLDDISSTYSGHNSTFHESSILDYMLSHMWSLLPIGRRQRFKLNLKDKISGETALMYAVKKDNGEAVRMLLEYGADYEVKNNDGQTAKDIADTHIRYDGMTHIEMSQILSSFINKVEFREGVTSEQFKKCLNSDDNGVVTDLFTSEELHRADAVFLPLKVMEPDTLKEEGHCFHRQFLWDWFQVSFRNPDFNDLDERTWPKNPYSNKRVPIDWIIESYPEHFDNIPRNVLNRDIALEGNDGGPGVGRGLFP
jgi:ankyrin repeat protein